MECEICEIMKGNEAIREALWGGAARKKVLSKEEIKHIPTGRSEKSMKNERPGIALGVWDHAK